MLVVYHGPGSNYQHFIIVIDVNIVTDLSGSTVDVLMDKIILSIIINT